MAELILSNIYAPSGVQSRMPEITSLYQEAFANAPWNERTKCPIGEPNPSCPSGYSALKIGELCVKCNLEPTEIAYPEEELLAKFTSNAPDSGYNLWYLEEQAADRKIVLAAFARITTISGLTKTAFSDDQPMQDWMADRYPDKDQGILWVEDVFANTDLRPENNLAGFDGMLKKLAKGTSVEKYMFKTLNPKLVRAAQRDFPNECKIADPVFNEIPSRSMLVSIDRPRRHTS